MSQKILKKTFIFCLYLVMNDLLFQREKYIKDELLLWFCLGFLINICYTKLDSPLNAWFLSIDEEPSYL